ncbi:MAG: hypothetical protein K6D97_06065 [Clostridia bacterium]|nr:hypothetical protein [Clostridia bacterium]
MNEESTKFFEEAVKAFEEAEKTWALSNVDIHQIIQELFDDKIDDDGSFYGISHVDVIKKCENWYNTALGSSKPMEQCIEIIKKGLPETGKVVEWLYHHNSVN